MKKNETLSDESYVHPEKKEYTKKEKFLNFMDYYKWWLVCGAIVLSIIVSIVVNALGIGVVKPDYQIACITETGLSEQTADELENTFAAFGEDLNGDGTVKVTINQYIMGSSVDPENEMYYSYAADVKLQADIISCDSYFFLTENPAKLQKQHQILADREGNLPDEFDFETADKAYKWSDCPAHNETELSEDAKKAVSKLYFGRRGFYDTSKVEYLSQYDAMWKKLMGGVF